MSLSQSRNRAVLWLAGAWGAMHPGAVSADGGFFKEQMFAAREPVSSPGQKAVIIRDGETHEILLLQTTYRGPSGGFAWVIPVPGRPGREDVFEANPEVFTLLDQQTRPRVRVRIEDPLGTHGWGRWTKTASEGVDMAQGGGADRVIVHDRMDVGDYDVSILSATGPGVLVDWLNRNGYGFPREAETIADDYVERESLVQSGAYEVTVTSETQR